MKSRIKKILLTVVTIATVIVAGNYGVKNVQALNITEENIVVGKNQSVNVIEGAVTSDYIILLNENGTLPENVNYFEGNKEITVGEAEETKTVSYIQLTQSEVDKIGTPKTEIMPDTVSANAVSVNSVKMSEELWTVQEIAKEHWNNSANRKRINVTCDATAPTVTSVVT